MNKAILQANLGTPIRVSNLPQPSEASSGLVYYLTSNDTYWILSNNFWKQITKEFKTLSLSVRPSTEEQVKTPDSGFDGFSEVVIEGDENLIAKNIAKDVSIFGVVGTLEGGQNPLEAATQEEMEKLLIIENIGKYVKYTGPTNDKYVKDMIYQISEEGTLTKYMIIPILENEGFSSDLSQGKQLINSAGEVITGTREEVLTDVEHVIWVQKRRYAFDLMVLPNATSGEIVEKTTTNSEGQLEVEFYG